MMRVATVLVYAFVLFAPLVVVFHSFSPTATLELDLSASYPTLRWYENLLDQGRLVSGIFYSFLIATFATLGALATGIPAAWALSRSNRASRRFALAFFLSPLNLPGLVLAVGFLMALARFAPSLIGTVVPLLAMHLLVTVPWVIRTVSAGLELRDPRLEDAARGLGASPTETFFLVTLPVLRPSIVASAIFAFIVSFGNFALSLFFSSGTVTTLPVAIFEYIDQFQDPTVAAASTLVIGGTTLLVVVASLATRRRSLF